MYNFERDKFDEMTTEEKKAFVDNLVNLKIKLKKKEIPYLTDNNIDIYTYNSSRTSEWLNDYEFDVLPEKEKHIYISSKRFIGKDVLEKLSEDMQMHYVISAVFSGVELPEDIFDSLKTDKVRTEYIKYKIKYSSNSNLSAKEILYLTDDEQIQYLRLISKMGLALNDDEIKSLKPKALRLYKFKKELMKEVRIIIRKEIRSIF